MKRHKILVTGGAGFIGSHTAVALYEAGFMPVLLDNFSNSKEMIVDRVRLLTEKDVPFYEGDCRDHSILTKIFQEHSISGVIHFAAFKAVGESVEKPLMYYNNNIVSHIVLLDEMKKHGINNLVFSSSCTVYGNPESIPVTENAPADNASSPYGFTKVICEKILKNYCENDSAFKTIMLRYFNPIGAHPSGVIGELPQGIPNNLVPYITQTAVGIRKELTIHGGDYKTADGTCIRDYIHVMDLADAHIKAIEKLLSVSTGTLDAYNVGTGSGASVLDVVRAFEKVNDVNVSFKIGPRRGGDVESIWASTTKIEKEFGWKAKYSLEDCLRDSWNWEKKLLVK